MGLPKTLLPIYTLGTTWTFTPKLTLNASASKTVAPPTTVIANAETSYMAQMTLVYQLTPKVAVNVGGSIGYTNGAFTPATVTGLDALFAQALRIFTRANAGLTYAMTPVPVGRAERLIYRAGHRPYDYPGRFGDRKPAL